MTLKQSVEHLFIENTEYLRAQHALNLAQSLKALSDDLYTDSVRFLYELIQNADDAYDRLNVKKPLIRIAIVDKKYLIVANFGKPFDEFDLRGICNVGCGTKKQNLDKTGYKGLGFKAVFGKSDYILIASKGEFFRFDAKAKEFQWNEKWGPNQTTWEKLNGQKFEFPWQICPIWTDASQLPKSLQNWLFAQPEIVATVIYLKNITETEQALQILIQQPHVFMFLKHIKDIRISTDSSSEINLNISQIKDGSIKILNEKKIFSHWLLHSCQLNVPEEVRADPRLPDKLRNEKLIELTLAAFINENDQMVPVRGADNVLFACLPTKISTYNLPILINSKFLVNASREHIHIDSPWNQWLFSCIPTETFRWIQQLLNSPKWTDKAYDLLPNPISHRDLLADRYNQNCSNSIKQIPFVFTIDKKIILINEAVVDVTLFSSTNCLGYQSIRDYILHINSSKRLQLAKNPFVKNNHRLQKLGIMQFTWETCIQMLKSRFFLTNFTIEQNIQFINYLYLNRNLTQIQKRLYELPFLMDQNGILLKVTEIYFPSRFSSADWLLFDNADAYVHPDIMAWLSNQSQIKDWLRKLGIQEKTDITFIEQYIIPNVRTYINHENAFITMTRLFHLFHFGLLTTRHCQELRKLKIYSLDGSLQPADQLYFSADYSPYLPLDDFELDKQLFLSPHYLGTIEDASIIQWKHLFQSLGVQENISLVPINNEGHNELVAAYMSTCAQQLPNYAFVQGFKNFLTILFLESTQTNYEFAVFFWEHVIRSISVNHLNEPDIMFTQRHNRVDNLPQWCVRKRACIPTTTGNLLPSREVFSNELSFIAGKYLPVFACNVRNTLADGWKRFFEFKNELNIEDCFLLLNLIYNYSYNYSLNDDDERRIQLIYTTLINRLVRLDETQRKNRNQTNKSLYLLTTQDNRFISSDEIAFSIDKNVILPMKIPQLKLSTENTQNPHLQLLLDVMKIRQIRMNDLSLLSNLHAQFSHSLHRKLRDIQPYLFALAESRKLTNHNIDYDLEIFESERLDLYYNQTILVCQVLVHFNQNQLYVRTPWNTDDVMQVLCPTLCKQFTLPENFQSDLKFLLTQSIETIEEHFHKNDMPVHDRLFEDLLNVGGKREKFAAMIERDNNRLFHNRNITSTMHPADVLIECLEAQDSKWTGYVYHFTHLENAVQILSERKLKARGQLLNLNFKDSAAENVIKSTRTLAKNYTRFYFRPMTPTQRCNENLGSNDLIERFGNKPMCPVPIFFRINLRSLLTIENLSWKVSLGNLASQYTEFDCTRDIIDKFDFEYIYTDTRTERGKFSSQHEFLVESHLDLSLLSDKDVTLIFQDENACDSLKSMIDGLQYEHMIDSSFFLGYNPRVKIQHSKVNPQKITVFIDKGIQQTDDNGKLVVQIASNTMTTKSITGTLIGVFNRDNILTVLGKERISFVPGTNHVQFSVYYQYKQQEWLIHTNYSNPKFVKLEKDYDDF